MVLSNLTQYFTILYHSAQLYTVLHNPARYCTIYTVLQLFTWYGPTPYGTAYPCTVMYTYTWYCITLNSNVHIYMVLHNPEQ